jgi:hypothetical protein
MNCLWIPSKTSDLRLKSPASARAFRLETPSISHLMFDFDPEPERYNLEHSLALPRWKHSFDAKLQSASFSLR